MRCADRNLTGSECLAYKDGRKIEIWSNDLRCPADGSRDGHRALEKGRKGSK